MKKPELLAPAGNMECLVAAISAGCDAVYIGGNMFGARSYAGNFNNEEIMEAIKYAHLYGVKVYVTVNTLVYDKEVEEFMNYIDFLHKNNVDAIIIQDLGMLDLVRKTYPNLEIHASTQMHIHNLEGVKFASDMGIKRVVLARETDIDTIKYIKENTNIELEIFIHGALCISYSGQCLMSYFLTGRSGNRGTCSQPCRMKYDIVDDKKINKDNYLLSTKDLNTILNIGELIKSGIDSLKIEGRMKRPEYVYLITSLYRKAIDNYIKYKDTKITNEDINEMKKIFNREFTKGFIFNEDNNKFTNEYRPNHLGIEIGKVIEVDKKIKIKLSSNLNQGDGIRIIGSNDDGGIVNKLYKKGKLVNSALQNEIIELDNIYKVKKNDIVLKTTDIEQLNEIKEKINNKRKVNIKGCIELYINKPIKLIFSDGYNKVEVLGNIVEQSNNVNMKNEDIKKQITKLGNTIYNLEELEIKRDENIFVRVSELNELRRNVVEKLNEARLYKIEYQKEKYDIKLTEYNEEKGYSYLINKKEDLNKIKDYKYIYTENEELVSDNIIYKLPRVIKKVPIGNYLCSEIGSVYLNKNISDFSLNVTNSYTVAFLNSLGVKRVTLSYEMKYDDIELLINNYKNRYKQNPNLEVIISSYPEVMVTKYNLLKKYNIKNGYLKDINDKKFKLIERDNLIYIKNYEKINLDSEILFKLGVNTLRIEI